MTSPAPSALSRTSSTMAQLTEALQHSERMRQRRFEWLPMRGAVHTDIQGRGPGPATSAEGLADLITSISAAGVLHPVLIEELPQPDGSTTQRLVIGERRYRALRWGAVNQPDNPHFEALPAVICPGPITDEERRTWQLVENLAREDLQPGELAKALLLERSAILYTQLLNAEIYVDDEILLIEDPVARFQALEKLRGSDANLAAPWPLVLRRLGLQITARRARELVSAFRTLPREVSSDMDEHQVSLAARTNLARLTRGRREAASEIWQAVKRLGRSDLLSAVVKAKAQDPEISAEEAVTAAGTMREEANAARSAALTRTPEEEEQHDEPGPHQQDDAAGKGAGAGPAPATGDHTGETHAPAPTAAVSSIPAGEDRKEDPAPEPESAPPVDPEVARGALDSLRALNGQLTEGRVLHRFDAGSLRMLLTDLNRRLPADRTTERNAA
ncbi:ParB N-terminal domain-containing protein [Streptomyces sp. NPDC020667]|uniref:ParB N-terminal domain-containing protein n=1 Tax=Streptomyces sp. NPDC020667 TaxID=3154895 RepID=UPI0034002F94